MGGNLGAGLDAYFPILATGVGLFFVIAVVRAFASLLRLFIATTLLAATIWVLAPRMAVSHKAQNRGCQKSGHQCHDNQHGKQRR